MAQLTWTIIDEWKSSNKRGRTEYAAVAGGWLVRTVETAWSFDAGQGAGGLCFIPDPHHETPPLPI